LKLPQSSTLCTTFHHSGYIIFYRNTECKPFFKIYISFTNRSKREAQNLKPGFRASLLFSFLTVWLFSLHGQAPFLPPCSPFCPSREVSFPEGAAPEEWPPWQDPAMAQ
jgi:hypothetical protein